MGGGGGGDGDAHFLEAGASETLFGTAGITLNNFAKFLDAGIFLAKFEESHAFLEAGRGEFETLGIVVKNLVVFVNGLLIVFLGVGDFSEPELSVGSEIGVAVVLQIVGEFRIGKLIFAAGEVAKTVGVKSIGRRRGAAGAAECSTATGRNGRSSTGGSAGNGGRSAASEASINALDGILKINELLIEFSDAGFDFFEIVGETLKLRGHGVETGAGIGLNILDGFLEGGHGGVELVDGIGRLLDESFLDSMVLSHLGLDVFLALEEGGDVALELDDLASDSECGLRADQTAGNGAGEQSRRKDEDVASPHGRASRKKTTAG